MASRPLAILEMIDFLDRHDDVKEIVQAHEGMFNPIDGFRKWDQVLAASGVDEFGNDLPIPPRGLAVSDEVFGNVVVFPDAEGILHYTSTDNRALVDAIRKPLYESDPEYWELYESVARKYGEAAAGAMGHIDLGLVLAVGLVLIVLVKR